MDINSDRLTLKRLSENDADFILKLLNTEGWLKFIGDKNVRSYHDALDYIRKICSNEDISYFTIFLKNTNTSIGLVSVIKRNYLACKDVGYALLPDYYSCGYAFEAMTKLIDTIECTKQSELSIAAITIKENDKSIRLLDKLGFRYSEEINQNNQQLMLYLKDLHIK